MPCICPTPRTHRGASWEQCLPQKKLNKHKGTRSTSAKNEWSRDGLLDLLPLDAVGPLDRSAILKRPTQAIEATRDELRLVDLVRSDGGVLNGKDILVFGNLDSTQVD